MAINLFEKNPFVVPPGEFWADRKFLWQMLMDYIEIARMTRSNEIIALVGDYGCGTTHTLKYLEKYLKQKGAFVSYFATPVKGNLSSLYRGFLDDIPSDKKRAILEQLAEDLIESPEVRAKLERFSAQEIEDAVLGIISGLKLTLRQRRISEELGISQRLPSTIEIWGRILMDLTTKELPVFVLIDEFDAALFDRTSAQELLFDLRRLYDETLFGMCIVVGLKGEPKDVEAKLGSALHSRMSLQPIYLTPLSKREGRNFLKDVLKHTYGKREQEFLPFTKESVETLISISCPCTPRRLLRICSVIFEEARRNRLERIDRDFVLDVVTKFGEVSISIPLPSISKPEARREVGVRQPVLVGVIEYGSNGTPNILADPSKLTAKDVIGLILYSKHPTLLTLREITDFTIKNWKNVSMRYVAANIAQMRGRVIKEGKRGSFRYKLSGLGESWIRSKLIPKLKGEKPKLEGKLEKDKRGGKRRAFISPKIDQLIEEDYFKLPKRRTVNDVIKTLVEKKGLPVTGKYNAVLVALKRRVGKTLIATREDRQWVFWTE